MANNPPEQNDLTEVRAFQYIWRQAAKCKQIIVTDHILCVYTVYIII